MFDKLAKNIYLFFFFYQTSYKQTKKEEKNEGGKKRPEKKNLDTIFFHLWVKRCCAKLIILRWNKHHFYNLFFK